jgi:hypothetical protein
MKEMGVSLTTTGFMVRSADSMMIDAHPCSSNPEVTR